MKRAGSPPRTPALYLLFTWCYHEPKLDLHSRRSLSPLLFKLFRWSGRGTMDGKLQREYTRRKLWFSSLLLC